MNRYQLNATHFFEIVDRFLRSENVPIFQIELERMDPVYHSMIAMEVSPILEDLLHDITITDNVVNFFLTREQLVIVAKG